MVLAAYIRNFWLLGAVVLVLLAALVVGAMHVDRLLRQARRQARAASIAASTALLTQAKPVTTRAQTRPGPLAWWGTRSKISHGKLVQRLTKLRCVDGRDVLVSAITNGKWSWRDMAAGLEMYRLGGKARSNVQQVLESSPRSGLLRLADLCFRQNALNDDILNAATLYKFVYQRLGAAPFQTSRRGEFFLDALARTGQGSEVIRLQSLYGSKDANSNDLHLYRANAANPFKDETLDLASWLTEINDMYRRAGLAPLVLEEGAGPAFLRLRAEETAAVTDGPLVSIVMPVFRPDAYTDLAIGSAINQSYRNIEIIIVDDGSGGDAAERLNAWAAVDSRITVVINPRNSGSLHFPQHRLLTGHGRVHDDFRRRRLAASAKDRTPGPDRYVPKATSVWSPHLGRALTRISSSTTGDGKAHSSLRRTSRPCSTSKRSANASDTGIPCERLRTLSSSCGTRRWCTVTTRWKSQDAPLTLSLVGSSNLSIDDFRLGYRSPDRVAYRDSYEHWHKSVLSGEHNGHLEFPRRTCFSRPLTFPARGPAGPGP